MMSKLGVLLTICLLLFPLTAVPLDGDQPADRPAERMQDGISSEHHPFFDSVKKKQQCCPPVACNMGCEPCCG
uniref:Conotoxin TxMMSK-04 n=2 Tax=Conus TaxID=6490 RepID=M234_CONTE|nr:RecName: Full=Conotoxin TxMMSK-04; Flags: Precursor [Conus textile]AAG60356.1 conotoxin scaffold III/IV precursor [Conus textile]AEX60403.1 M superfamily MMSK group conopeptide Vt+Da3-EP01 [Conus planorbis]